ncbi:MAG: sulfurtransferase TusA family protein [Chloroflexota bacterium]|nr:sulfurtransferase TusA family protein [Chloroflexota bacterium]
MINIKAHRSIDTRQNFSPYPEIETRDALKAMAKGQVLEVLGDDPVARTTIVSLCHRLGYFYQVFEEAKGQWRLLIERTA